jgi:hypothetical protein
MGTLHQLKITLREVKPAVWRRLLIPADFKLDRVHRTLNWAMGWTDSHLHEFEVGKQRYGIPDVWEASPDEEDVIPERKVTLSTVLPKEQSRGRYIYDFGDFWQHDLLVEKILEADVDGVYPVCLDGKGACPPEDCGGVSGYAELRKVIADPAHPEHQSMLLWLGGHFHPDEFSVAQVNARLRSLRRRAPKPKN